jgi:uncharacterized protein (DUF58 family)
VKRGGVASETDAAGIGALLDALRGVAWPARDSIMGGASGTHRSRLRGLSAEFTEYRPYRQGDDPRRLDWKLLARTDRAFLRITSDRATLATVLLVDTSQSMFFPAEGAAKWRMTRLLAVALAAVARAAGDPVGLVVPGERGVQPGTRRGVVAEIARVLWAVRPAASPPLAPELERLRGVPRVAVLSDFLGDEAEERRAARELVAQGSEVHAIHLVAREELEPPAGAILAIDPERSEVRRALAAESRAAYQERFAAWRLETARAWREAAASWTGVVADEPAERAVRRIVNAGNARERRA